MRKVLALVLLGVGAVATASAGFAIAPEIDASSGVSALTLLAGAVLVIRGRRK